MFDIACLNEQSRNNDGHEGLPTRGIVGLPDGVVRNIIAREGHVE